MKLFGKHLSDDALVVAEIGVNHEGSFEAAARMLRLAAEAGADAVKFQTYTPSRYASASDTSRLERVSNFALNEGEFARLADLARETRIGFFSTPLTEDTVQGLSRFCPALKIASGDLTFEPVIRAAAGTGLPVVLSTGTGTTEEIDRAVSWVDEEIGSARLQDQLVLMHCVASYPTPIEQANLASIPFLKKRYGLVTGWSHHCMGPDAALAATALGAEVIEVHFTDSRQGRTFRDHELSFEPDELAALVRSVRAIRSSIGKSGKFVQPCEAPIVAAIRKGVVAARDLPPGHQLQREDLMFARPASEFASGEINNVIGKTLRVGVRSGELIRRDAIN